MRSLFYVLLPLLAACAAKSPAPEPATAAPTENKLQLCVIDTIAPGGMMSIGAIHVIATNDTLILQQEGRIPIAKALAGPKVLREATWMGPKSPILITRASGRAVYAQTGTPKVQQPGKVALLAMMRGVPIFAAPGEGGPMRAELEALAARGVDLENALRQRSSLRRQMDRVQTLYVPTSLVGCEFQAFTAPRRRR